VYKETATVRGTLPERGLPFNPAPSAAARHPAYGAVLTTWLPAFRTFLAPVNRE